MGAFIIATAGALVYLFEVFETKEAAARSISEIHKAHFSFEKRLDRIDDKLDRLLERTE
jgi:predicted mannosyl-3-phosphoglycerate phosphatase (HAD superfamily)